MRGKTYRVELTAEEKKWQEDIVNQGAYPAGQIKRARIMLLLNGGRDSQVKPVKELERSEIAERRRAVEGWCVPLANRRYKRVWERHSSGNRRRLK